MKRNFPNFLDAFIDYAKDDICPDTYITWMGLSVLAAALERKVWIADGPRITYPNLFLLLVGTPGVGKSQAIGKGKPLLYGIQQAYNPDFKIIEGISTQAGLCEAMERGSMFEHPTLKSTLYSSVYVMGSEASDSALKNHADDFRSTACAMYDCEHIYAKTLKSKAYLIHNPVMNLVAGSTFDFLKTIVDQNSVMGGLASRFTYVIAEKKFSRQSSLGCEAMELDRDLISRLTYDLSIIHRMVGQFRIESAALDLHQMWWEKHCAEMESTESERMQSLLVRKPMLLKKVLMLLSVADRNDLGILAGHMERAITLVDQVTEDIDKVISEAMMGNKTSQDALNRFVVYTLKEAGGEILGSRLKQKFFGYGGDMSRFEGLIKFMVEANIISMEAESRDFRIKLLVDPNTGL